MMQVWDYAVMGVIIISTILYVWSHLLNRKLEIKTLKFWIVFIGLIIITVLNYYMVNNFIRIASITIILMLSCSYLFKENIKIGVVTGLTSQLLFMIAETIFAIIISLLFGFSGDFIENTQFGTILSNAAIAVIVILLSEFGYVKSLHHFFLRITRNIENSHLIVMILIFMVGLNIFSATAYYQLDFKMMLIFNVATMMIYFVIIISSIKNRHDYIEVYGKYNTTLSSLKEYEDILNKYRVSNHENRNQLMTIRNMIKNNEKNIPEYIDTLAENKLQDNEKFMIETAVIPEGGLRGLIYSKMLLMNDKGIQFELNVDKTIRTVELIELGDQTLFDICRIIGVFLDNAIEAVEDLEEKFVDLEMSIEKKKLYISITNNYKDRIDLEHMEEDGFTTKGKGHGHGLTLVKQLIENNPSLKNEKEITRDEFTQRLIIHNSKK